MNGVNVVFMGTPEFAVPALRALVEDGWRVLAAVTQPDRPRGRKRELAPPPVKVEAQKHAIPVLQPERLRQPEAVEAIRRLAPDLIVTAAFGQILPKAVLDLPRYGCINIHASLLPKYRGGAPVHRAIMNGETVTGVTLMYMAEGLDTGDMISKVEVPIGPEDNTGTMLEKLSAAGAELLRTTLPELIRGNIAPVPQDDAEATYAPNVKREDELIQWSQPAVRIYNQVRALAPEPGAFTYWNGAVFKIYACANPQGTGGGPKSRPLKPSDGLVPGTVLQCTEDGLEVLTGEGTLWLKVIQPAGKKAMDAAAFCRGGQMKAGAVLGQISESGSGVAPGNS
jgi:methionyl-tRNA formyltransferase